jgi:glycosyltransferase 2 family protein
VSTRTGGVTTATTSSLMVRMRGSLWTWLVVGLVVSSVLLWLAVRDIDTGTFRRTISGAEVLPLVAGAVFICLPWVVIGLRWRVAAGRMRPPSGLRMVGLVFAGAAVNNCLPGRLGDLARALGLARGTGRPVSEALGTTVVDRAADILFFGACFAVTALMFPGQDWLPWVGAGTLAVVLVLGALCVGIVLGARRDPSGGGRLRTWAAPHLRDLSSGLTGVRSPGSALRLALLTVLAWTCLFTGFWLVTRSLGIDLGAAEVVFLTTVISLGTALPSLPGFVGTFHWVASTVLQVFDVPLSQAVAAAVVLHALSFVPTTLIGLPIMLREGLGLRAIRGAAGPGSSPA